MGIVIDIYVVLIGLTIGSFLNVLIYRLPEKVTVSKGFSRCPDCRHRLFWLDLIPVFSFMFLKGKCRYCKNPISPRYPLVELLNAACYYLIYRLFGMHLQSLLCAVVCSCLIVTAMIDFDHKIILDRFNIIIGLCALVLGFVTSDITWVERIIGFFAVSVPFLIIVLVTGGMGEGDVKLIAVCGLLLGWKSILLTVLFASVTAALYGIMLMIKSNAKRKSQIPFGPFIAFSVIICLLFGDRIINWYISLLL